MTNITTENIFSNQACSIKYFGPTYLHANFKSRHTYDSSYRVQNSQKKQCSKFYSVCANEIYKVLHLCAF